MTPEALACLHARCFTTPRPWQAAEFAALLAMPNVFLLTADDGFLLGRTILDEAELLTLAVAPEQRRRRVGLGLVERFRRAARAAGATAAFLEVAADNAPARALYAASGWTEVGRRRGYYAPALDALILRTGLD